MFNCQFCGFDYSEQGLRDGRCPSCGVLLAWEDESQAADNSISDSELPSAPAPPSAHAAHPEPETGAPVSVSNPMPADDVPAPQPGASHDQSPQPATLDEPVSFAAPLPSDDVPPPQDQSPPDQPTSAERENSLPEQDDSPTMAEDESPREPVVGGQTIRRDIDPSQAFSTPIAEDDDAKYSRVVEQIWSRSLTERPTSTIQTPASHGTVSNLVIRKRAVSKGEVTEPKSTADYELLGVIGEGGVGVVYSARQASINRTVAVKMLREQQDDTNEKGKFLAEAVVTGELDHPNIVPIYDLGSNEEGALFYSMKQVQGTPWSEVIFHKPLAENIEILMKVGDAVAFAHARGVVHRDLKPENVMLGEFGEVLLMDWGMALSTSMMGELEGGEPHAGMGGTPAYMAPEMATGPLTKIGPASDVYLLGAILFETITGRPPHRGKTVMDCIGNAACNRIIPTNRNGELLDIAYKAMSTEPEDRYSNVKEIQQAIRDYESHLESVALVQRGNQALAEAETTRDYKEYARSIVAFEEGLALWRSNESAAKGLDDAIAAYADAAYSKSDYELGLSLLDDSVAQHKPLIAKLRRGLKERNARQQRIASLRRTAVALVLLMLAGASVATVICFTAWTQTNSTLAKNELLLDEKNGLLDEKNELLDETKRAQERAEAALQKAEDAAKREAKSQHGLEVVSASEAVSRYVSGIQLANERIHDNAFPEAMRLLDAQKNEIQRKLRHWEWGRLRYLCELEEATLARFDDNATATVMAVAAAIDKPRVAIGFADGRVLVWEQQGRPWADAVAAAPTVIDTGRPLTALAISRKGDLLAIGADDGAESDIVLYRIGEARPQPVRRMKGHRDAVTSLQFSRDDKQLLSSSKDHTARLWIPFSSDAPRVFYGHFDAVRSAKFSNDEELVVTASDDGSARIWSPKNEAQLAQFTEHTGAVSAALFLPGDLEVATGGADGKISIWKPAIDDAIQKAGKTAKSLFEVAQVKRATAMLSGAAETTPTNYHSFAAHDGHVRALTLTADGSLLISGGDDSSLRVWAPAALLKIKAASQGDASQDDASQNVATQSAAAAALQQRATRQDLERGLLTTLRGHGSWISSLVSLDGELRVLSGSYDRTAKIWNLAEYQEVESHDFVGRKIVSAAQSADGNWLAAALDDGTARVLNKQREMMRIPPLQEDARGLTEGHSYLTTNAVLIPQSNRLYMAAGDNTVSVWDYATAGQLKKLPATGREGVLAVSPDNQWLVTGGKGKSAWLWRNRERMVELDHPSFIASALQRTHPDASTEALEEYAKVATSACVAGPESIFVGDAAGAGWLWSVDQEHPDSMPKPRRKKMHRGRINKAVFLHDGRQLLTASSDYTVALWTLGEDAKAIVRLSLKAPVTEITVNKKQTRLAAATVLRTKAGEETRTTAHVHIARIGSDKPEKSVRLTLEDGTDIERINSLSFNDDGSAVVIACSVESKDHLFKWAPDRGTEPERLWDARINRGSISAALVTPTEDVLTVGGRGAVLWTSDGRSRRTFRPHSSVNSICFSPDARYVATTGADGVVKIWLITESTPRVVAKLELPDEGPDSGGHVGGVLHAQFHPTLSDTVLTAGEDGTARIWKFDVNAKTVSVNAIFGGENGHKKPVRQAVFSHDGGRIVTASDDATACVWDVDDSAAPLITLSHDAPVRCARFSHDDLWLATGATDNVARVWALDNEQPLVKFVGHSLAVTAVDFSIDRQRLLTASRDKTARLWDLTPENRRGWAKTRLENKEILEMEHHGGELTAAEFSSNGRSVMTASLDGQLSLAHSRHVEAAILLSVGEPVECLGQIVQVDPDALIRQPNVESYANYELKAEVIEAEDSETLTLEDDWHGSIRLRDGAIMDDDRGKKVADLEVEDSGCQLTVRLNGAATAASIEAIIRCLGYQNSNIQTGQTREIRIRLLDPDGRSGNFEDAARKNVRKVRLVAPPSKDIAAEGDTAEGDAAEDDAAQVDAAQDDVSESP